MHSSIVFSYFVKSLPAYTAQSYFRILSKAHPAQYAGWLHVIQKSLTRRWPAIQTLSWSGIQAKEVPFSLFYNPLICSQTPSGEVDICISRPSVNNEESSSGSFVVLMNFTPIFYLPSFTPALLRRSISNGETLKGQLGPSSSPTY